MITIMLDPGHSQKFPGASRNNIKEEEYTYNFCRSIQYIMERFNNDCNLDSPLIKPIPTIILSHNLYTSTPPSTKIKDFKKRAEEANKNQADCVISVHLNAHKYASWLSGKEIYYKDRTSLETAFEFGKHFNIKKYFRCHPQDWTKNAHGVLKRYTCPAFLIELGYLTNDEDFEAFKDQHFYTIQRLHFMAGLFELTKYLNTIKTNG